MLPIDSASQAIGLDVIAFRLLCALIIGVVIGTERENAHRPAGMRTHMLVALGACTVMLTSQLLYSQYSQLGANADPARMSAQVIAGVGFLGAGTIIREGASVRGLTTAASIWTVACLGIAAGAGYYAVCLMGTGCMLITLILFEWVQKKYMWGRYSSNNYEVRCRDVAAGLQMITEFADRYRVEINAIQTEKTGTDQYKISFHAAYRGRKADRKLRLFLADLTGGDGILSVRSERTDG